MIRNYDYPSGPPPADETRADRIRCLWHAVADWPADDAGDSVAGTLWAAILGRRVALEDSYGFRSLFTFRTPDDARAFVDNVAAIATPEDDGAAAGPCGVCERPDVAHRCPSCGWMRA